MRRKKSYLFLIGFVVLLVVIVGFVFISNSWQSDKPVLDLGRFSSEELFKYGQQKAKEGKLKEAKRYIEAALDKSAGNITYLGELAVIKYRMGDYNGAIKEYEKIAQNQAYRGFALNGIANIYRDQAQKTEDAKQKVQYQQKAVETYKEGIKSDPSYIALYSNYAIFLVSMDKVEQAREILNQGIDKTGSQELKTILDNIK